MAKKKKQEKPKEYTHRQLSHFKKQKRLQRIILITGITIIAAIILIPVIGWFISDYLPLRQTALMVNGTKFNVATYIDVIKFIETNQSGTDTGTVANNALEYMTESEILKQGAAKLGITASDTEMKTLLQKVKSSDSRGARIFYGAQLLVTKLRDKYFGSKVPEEDKQVHALAMLLETDQQAREIREKLVNGDNFTALDKQFAQNYYSKNVNQGDFGWHIREILKSQLGSDIPVDYAFSAGAGSLSLPLSDNASYKQVGYWLIKILDRPEEGKVAVQALLVSDNVVARDIKAKLEAGTASLADMADKYTQYSLSKQKQGDFGVINQSDNTTFTEAFNKYVFDPATPTGKWSDPIRDDTLSTQGGSWLVKVVETADKMKVSDEDRNSIIDDAFNTWFTELLKDPALDIKNDLLTPKMQQWVIDRVNKALLAAQGLN